MNRQIDEKIKAFVTQSSIPHLAVVIWHNSQLYHAHYGCEAQPEVDVFEIGSVGKVFTATLLAVLAEKNLLCLLEI